MNVPEGIRLSPLFVHNVLHQSRKPLETLKAWANKVGEHFRL